MLAIWRYEMFRRAVRSETFQSFMALSREEQKSVVRTWDFEDRDCGVVVPDQSTLVFPEWCPCPRWRVNLRAPMAEILAEFENWIVRERRKHRISEPRGIKPKSWRWPELLDIDFAKKTRQRKLLPYGESERTALSEAKRVASEYEKIFAELRSISTQ